MKVEADFINGQFTLNAQQILDLMKEAQEVGYKQGLKDGENRAPRNVSRPKITPVAPKNNTELIEKFLGDSDRAKVANMNYQEGFKEGHKEGYEKGLKGDGVQFDPKLHTDNSVYGYASTYEISKLNEANGHITILRNKHGWKKGTDVAFVRVTPHQEEKI